MSSIRFELYLPVGLVNKIKSEARVTGMTASAWALAIFEAAFNAQKPARCAEIPSDPQVAFLEQLAAHFHISVAAEKAGVSVQQAMGWLESPEFHDHAGVCQEMFLEKVEQKLLAIGMGTEKGNWGALIAFLNAHHPQHGLKAELMSRILGDVIEQFYGVVTELAGEDLGIAIKNQLRETAEKKLIQFKR